jgi:hypothetical protein
MIFSYFVLQILVTRPNLLMYPESHRNILNESTQMEPCEEEHLVDAKKALEEIPRPPQRQAVSEFSQICAYRPLDVHGRGFCWNLEFKVMRKPGFHRIRSSSRLGQK